MKKKSVNLIYNIGILVFLAGALLNLFTYSAAEVPRITLLAFSICGVGYGMTGLSIFIDNDKRE